MRQFASKDHRVKKLEERTIEEAMFYEKLGGSEGIRKVRILIF